jgi:hypothetical protein
VLRARAKLCKQRCARSVLGPCPNRRLRTSAVTGGPEEPQVGGPPRHAAGITRLGDSNLWSRRSEGGETPPSAASPPGSCQRCGGHLRRTLPSGRAGAVAARWNVVILASRATCVPQVAVTSGTWRSSTVTPTGSVAWASAPDLAHWSKPKLHGMQGVRGLGALGFHPG